MGICCSYNTPSQLSLLWVRQSVFIFMTNDDLKGHQSWRIVISNKQYHITILKWWQLICKMFKMRPLQSCSCSCMQDLSTRIKPLVYAFHNRIWFSLWKLLTCKPSTLWLTIKVSTAVIVLSFNCSGWVTNFSSLTRSSKTKVESLCVSRRAYVRISFLSSFTNDKKTGTILSSDGCLLKHVGVELMDFLSHLPSCRSRTFHRSFPRFPLSWCRQVRWQQPHTPQIRFVLQSLVIWPLCKHPKQRWFWWINALLPISLAAKTGHLATPSNLSNYTVSHRICNLCLSRCHLATLPDFAWNQTKANRSRLEQSRRKFTTIGTQKGQNSLPQVHTI